MIEVEGRSTLILERDDGVMEVYEEERREEIDPSAEEADAEGEEEEEEEGGAKKGEEGEEKSEEKSEPSSPPATESTPRRNASGPSSPDERQRPSTPRVPSSSRRERAKARQRERERERERQRASMDPRIAAMVKRIAAKRKCEEFLKSDGSSDSEDGEDAANSVSPSSSAGSDAAATPPTKRRRRRDRERLTWVASVESWVLSHGAFCPAYRPFERQDGNGPEPGICCQHLTHGSSFTLSLAEGANSCCGVADSVRLRNTRTGGEVGALPCALTTYLGPLIARGVIELTGSISSLVHPIGAVPPFELCVEADLHALVGLKDDPQLGPLVRRVARILDGWEGEWIEATFPDNAAEIRYVLS